MNKSASMVLGVYAHHLFALAKAVRDGCDQVFVLAPIPAKDGYIKVSSEVHACIDAVLIDAANLKKLIRTPPDRGKRESTRVFQFRRQRTDLLADFLKGLSVEALCDVQVRNSLEHFDEHLDKLGARLEAGEAPPQPAVAYNLVFSSMEVVARMEVYPLRLYVADRKTYYNFDHHIDLGRLREESATIVERVKASGALKEDEPGGLMVVFPKAP